MGWVLSVNDKQKSHYGYRKTGEEEEGEEEVFVRGDASEEYLIQTERGD